MNNVNAGRNNRNKATYQAEELNELLANYSIFYQNKRKYHRNITGEKIPEFQDQWEVFKEGDAVIIGISGHSVESHRNLRQNTV